MLLIRINTKNLGEYLNIGSDEFLTVLDSAIYEKKEKPLENVLQDTMVLHDYGLDSNGYYVDVYLTKGVL